jgi:hypothetical protein
MLHSSITNALGGPSSLVKMSLKGREMGGSREFGKEITNAGSTSGGNSTNGILSSTTLHPQSVKNSDHSHNHPHTSNIKNPFVGEYSQQLKTRMD